ncbi:tryptophan halogenase family protein [Gilvimarinus polysaccharolyticus]|uniref:tryptophan halogenase family protein n=1 Tax=Gilvimarinus polysaccharolyticus TaxID=863921 RepID=UPI0006731BC5|nr:tryptophan halogenase family protein [Gilvimarinus polysaccharolyticus]
MQQEKKREILIVGGGTAGWMTAAALARFLDPRNFKIRLVESDAIGTVGVGEATIPHIRQFNDMLGIDENEFMRATNATYKLGIQFNGWGDKKSSYIHPFGLCGHDINGVDFHHYWLRLQKEQKARPFGEYSFAVQAANAHKFDYPISTHDGPRGEYGYAFHLDATLYAQFLRKYACDRSVERIEGRIIDVDAHADAITAIQLENGSKLSAEIFIDCSGFKSLLLGEALQVPYESWGKWLPCDRAVAVGCERVSVPNPYTQTFANDCGWRWRIPLTSRTGNGAVYSSKYISDDEAASRLIADLDAPALADPRIIKFEAGKREQGWKANCIAIGLASGFLEPLESTSIYLIQVAIQKLLEFFPGEDCIGLEREIYNRQMNLEYDRIRDFLILHYWLNRRDDSAFWRECAAMSLPESLQEKINLFRVTAQVKQYRQGLFMPASWLAVYFGQGLIPKSYDSRVNVPDMSGVERYLEQVYGECAKELMDLPFHEQALARVQASAAIYPPSSLSLYGAKT